MPTRRAFLAAGGLSLAGLALPGWARALARAATGPPPDPDPTVIRMISEDGGARVRFDPAGLALDPGDAVRWVLESGAHSTTAYHPDDDGRPLRIPATAMPWDSGILFEPGATFEVRLTVPGVYDYCCVPHEAAGMVGRLVVGTPGEDFTLPGWLRDVPPPRGSRPIPDAALAAFPAVDRILARGRVPG